MPHGVLPLRRQRGADDRPAECDARPSLRWRGSRSVSSGSSPPAGDSYRPKETALCETGRFFFGSTGPSERFALILSGIGGLARWIRVRVFFVHDRPPFRVGAPFGCPGRRGTRGDELKPVGKAVRSFFSGIVRRDVFSFGGECGRPYFYSAEERARFLRSRGTEFPARKIRGNGDACGV